MKNSFHCFSVFKKQEHSLKIITGRKNAVKDHIRRKVYFVAYKHFYWLHNDNPENNMDLFRD